MASAVAGQDGFERFDVLQFRFRRHNGRNAIQTKHQLAVDRVLNPQRAVLVEGGNALLWRDEIRRTNRGGFRHEFDDCLFGGAVVPRGQWVLGFRAGGTTDNERQHGEG